MPLPRAGRPAGRTGVALTPSADAKAPQESVPTRTLSFVPPPKKKDLHGVPGNKDKKISVGAAEGCDLLIFSNLQIAKARSKDRSLRQLLQGNACTTKQRGRAQVLSIGQPGMDGGGLCRSELAPGGVPTKNLRAPRGVRLPAASLTSIASNRASTGCSYRREKSKKNRRSADRSSN